MAKSGKKAEALQLRKSGKSIQEICGLIGTSKSTVSYWCRDIQLTPSQQRNLSQRQIAAGARGRLRSAEVKRAARLARTKSAYQQGFQDIAEFSSRDMYILGLGLYWGEGYKKGNEECGLTNSDPGIIMVFIEWLKMKYGISAKDLILRVSINEMHRHRINAVEKYWSDVTSIPLSQFTTASLIHTPARKVYSDMENHFGTLRVKVRRATTLRRRIMGSIQELQKRFK